MHNLLIVASLLLGTSLLTGCGRHTGGGATAPRERFGSASCPQGSATAALGARSLWPTQPQWLVTGR